MLYLLEASLSTVFLKPLLFRDIEPACQCAIGTVHAASNSLELWSLATAARDPKTENIHSLLQSHEGLKWLEFRDLAAAARDLKTEKSHRLL